MHARQVWRDYIEERGTLHTLVSAFEDSNSERIAREGVQSSRPCIELNSYNNVGTFRETDQINYSGFYIMPCVPTCDHTCIESLV